MPADVPRLVFRPSPPSYLIVWVLTTFFVLPGQVLVLGGLGWGDRIVGAALLLLAAFFIRAMATSGADSDSGGTGLLGLDAPTVARVDRGPVLPRRPRPRPRRMADGDHHPEDRYHDPHLRSATRARCGRWAASARSAWPPGLRWPASGSPSPYGAAD